MSRVIVIGSGAAGLTAALEAAREHEVVLLSKGSIGASNSQFAQGGIAAAVFDDDSAKLHLADTLLAGAGLSDERAARILCEEGPASVARLLELGMPFDRDGVGLARAQEAAHSRARVVHAGGDATGRSLIDTLVAAVKMAPVTVIENAFGAELLVRDGAVCGVDVIRDKVRRELFEADAVIIATGGAGQLYRHSTNPGSATADGVAAALRAGAELRDLEFYQFHPTALAVEGTPLISEAVRGEGATLLDGDGNRFMLAEHPDAELAPRDVVARAIARRMEQQGGSPVFLDATGIGADALRHRFPGFWNLCARHGLDPSAQPVPVTPAAHYWMGGIATDEFGRSSLPGLYAVGEAACTGAHGANRLASNSLLEALVFAHRTAANLSQGWPAQDGVVASAAGLVAVPDATRMAVVGRAALQDLMWRYLGLSRDADGLATAQRQLAVWTGINNTVYERETANLLAVARAMVEAALARTASVGAHFRSDDDASSDALLSPDSARKVALAC